MVDWIVSFVATKLSDLIGKEAERLGEVGKQVKWMERELVNIRCYLKDAHSKRRKGHESVENWLAQLRDIAYRIEDAIDIFYVDLEGEGEDQYMKNHCSFFGRPRKVLRKAMEEATNVPALRKLGTELDDIQKELEEIFKSKERYQITPLQQQGYDDVVVMPKRRAVYHDVHETEIVGLVDDEKNILKLLRAQEMKRRAVITIVGPGGLGKTTLARKIYNRQGHIVKFLSFFSLLHLRIN